MDLVLSEEQELLARTAREFVTGRSSLKRIRRLRDAADPDGFSRDLWREMAALGWLGITIPEEHGGAGLGSTALCVIVEELARVDAGLAIAVAVQNGLGAAPLVAWGTPQQREHWLPDLASARASPPTP